MIRLTNEQRGAHSEAFLTLRSSSLQEACFCTDGFHWHRYGSSLRSASESSIRRRMEFLHSDVRDATTPSATYKVRPRTPTVEPFGLVTKVGARGSCVDSPHGLILFDGVCVLCSRGCGFVSKHDGRGYFRFVPMQLAEGRPLAEQLSINPDRPDSFAFVAKIRSRAAHRARASAVAVDMAISLYPPGDPRRNL
jgi:hypothetical protein